MAPFLPSSEEDKALWRVKTGGKVYDTESQRRQVLSLQALSMHNDVRVPLYRYIWLRKDVKMIAFLNSHAFVEKFLQTKQRVCRVSHMLSVHLMKYPIIKMDLFHLIGEFVINENSGTQFQPIGQREVEVSRR